jgi:hypothetical protein
MHRRSGELCWVFRGYRWSGSTIFAKPIDLITILVTFWRIGPSVVVPISLAVAAPAPMTSSIYSVLVTISQGQIPVSNTNGLSSGLHFRVPLRSKKPIIARGSLYLCGRILPQFEYRIHRPPTELFQVFDRLLLLRKGGQIVYFGDLEQNSKTKDCLPIVS